MATTKNIQSVERTFAILELFQKTGFPELSLREISSQLDLNKSTAFGLVNTLMNLGYLQQNAENKKYALGIRVLSFIHTAKTQNTVIRTIHPHLEHLSRKYGETLHCAGRFGDGVVLLDKLEPTGSVSINTNVGSIQPVHCTGVGKCILAYLPEKDQERILSAPLQAYTPNTITDPKLLRSELDKIRRQGFAEDNEEIAVGVSCLAVPVLSGPDTVVCAVSATGISSQLQTDRENGLLDELIQMSAELTRMAFGSESR